MQFTFKRIWLQNLLLVSFGFGVLFTLFIFKNQLEVFYSPDRFFWILAAALIAVTAFLFLWITIKHRADALTTARTNDLLQTQNLFVELYRNSPVPYLMLESDGSITYPNHAALRLFGVDDSSSGGLAGVNVFEMFEMLEDEDQSRKSIAMANFANGIFVEAKDVIITRKDGRMRFGLMSIFPYGGGGLRSNRKGLMTIVDITKQKEVENAKSEFVSLASHQMRTPISSMRWNLELLRSPQFGQLTEGQLQYCEKAQNSLNKMNDIIEDFLSVSQLELGTKEISKDKIDLPALVNEVVEEFTGRIKEKSLDMQISLDQNLSSITTDRRLLHMVISNLVSNATKYTPEGGAVRIEYVADSNSVTFTIADSGVGIPIDDQDKLFTKFFRASNVRKQIISGTGLGLYIVKLAVEKMSGQISVSSKENEGAAFIVKLPIR